MKVDRPDQLEFSEIQPLMHDGAARRAKARKMIAVIEQHLGRSVAGLRAVDLGSSTGFIADEFTQHGAEVIGVDIDVPGMASAHEQFPALPLLRSRGEHLALVDESVDLVVYNHVYEHTADPAATMREIIRVLRPGGLAYLGLGNRLGIVEPHYKLPFLSYLTPAMADRYVRLARRGDAYHERFRTRRGLRRLVGGLSVWDYTWTVVAEPGRFGATAEVSWKSKVPTGLLRVGAPVVPTFLWIAVKGDDGPASEPPLRMPPRRVETADSPS